MNAIEVRNLKKIYRLYNSPTERLKEIFLRKPFHTPFVALDGVSFTVPQGETLGIIGENGAGKSTLLKILARTLKPTSGEVKINGRVAALLELGAGFNPELTGEENIYLNAYLLGLTKEEINRRKDEIIDFSELGDFIKRPVKTYSSGMYVRLAFSIATCVDPDILIVDEALAVGDQYFQKKCIDKMMEFKRSGKTIIFCSHALYLVQELCTKTIWLHEGKIEKSGSTAKVINAYNDWIREKKSGFKISTTNPLQGNGDSEKMVWIDDLKVVDKEGKEREFFKTGDSISLKLRVGTHEDNNYQGHIGIGINRNDEEPIFGVTTKMDGLEPIEFRNGQEIHLTFPKISLLNGQYYIIVAFTDEHALYPYDIKKTKMFTIENLNGELGIVRIEHHWHLPYRREFEKKTI